MPIWRSVNVPLNTMRTWLRPQPCNRLQELYGKMSESAIDDTPADDSILAAEYVLRLLTPPRAQVLAALP